MKMMKKLTAAVVIAGVCAISAGAQARTADQGKMYGAVRAGYGWTKYSANGTITTAKRAISSKSTGKGWFGGLAFGYNASNNVRGEVEVLFDDGLKGKKSATVGSLSVPAKTNVKSYGGLLNAYYDFKNQTAFTPYVSAGIGYMHNKAKVDATVPGTGGGAFSAKGKKNNFAWQVGAGVGFEVAKNMNLEVGYRLFQKSTKKINVTGTNFTDSVKVKYQHTALAGLRVSF
jgi:opacity protein-like surface antigen